MCGTVAVWSQLDLTAAALATTQLGLIHRDQLRALGFTDTAISRRLSKGVLVRRRSALFSFAGTPTFERQQLAEEVLDIGPTAAVSHDSAAHEWGMISRRPRAPHVVVTRWLREHRSSCVVHESLDLVEDDVVAVGGLPVTTPQRTVVDLGATSPWLVERALSRGLSADLFTTDDVAAFVRRVQRRGRRGVGVIRPLLELHSSMSRRSESVLEDRFARILFERSIPLPVAQYEVVGPHGEIICRADFAYPELGLLIELDGRSYHSDVETFQRDREKQNATQALGWRTIRFTWSDVTRYPDRTAVAVRSWLHGRPPSVLA